MARPWLANSPLKQHGQPHHLKVATSEQRRQNSNVMITRFAAALSSRGVVQVSGRDALRFLQGLVTNDIHEICGPDAPSVSPAAFLNGRGRLLFGTLMHRAEDNRYLIDLDTSRVPALIKHLTQYRLRAKVDVADVSADHAVWSIVGATEADAVESQAAGRGVVFYDPRLAALGKRAIVDAGFGGFDMPAGDESAFTRVRIVNGVPDGCDFDDTPLPLDLAFHLLRGVSFNKGCYLGQELTARSHFTGVLRKRVTPVAVLPAGTDTERPGLGPGLVSDDKALTLRRGTDIFVPGKKKAGGVVSSSVDNIGLAILRLNDALPDGASSGVISLSDGRDALAWRPGWWAERSADAVSAGES